MSDSREQFEAWVETLEGHPFAGQFLNLMWKAWQASRAQPERKPMTDAESHAFLVKMANHVEDWADSREYEPSIEECSGESLRYILAAQPAAATALQWISVKDRLPEVGELFLTVDEDSDLELLTLGGIKRHFGCITHWMLLPQPPAAQAQDDGEKP